MNLFRKQIERPRVPVNSHPAVRLATRELEKCLDEADALQTRVEAWKRGGLGATADTPINGIRAHLILSESNCKMAVDTAEAENSSAKEFMEAVSGYVKEKIRASELWLRENGSS